MVGAVSDEVSTVRVCSGFKNLTRWVCISQMKMGRQLFALTLSTGRLSQQIVAMIFNSTNAELCIY